ncbi:MAG: DUF1566 domain-containing protein [Bacteroidetes bacterium]|nr:DUF1566 domain-containing protein [Bacteroidota bacterium]
MKKLTKHLYFCLFLFLLFPLSLSAQVGVNGNNSNPDPSAMLDVQSTDKGMLIPRMTTAQRTAISNPATGLMVFDNQTHSFWFWSGSQWDELGSGGSSSDWSLTGNAGTNTTNNFIGTTDNMPLDIRVNNQRVMRYQPSTDSPNLIGGYSGNSISIGVKGATIAGGGTSTQENSITADFSVVSGGASNTASGYISTIGGGSFNEASGSFSVVGGGFSNKALGIVSTISGGDGNEANGNYSYVGGGRLNIAGGDYSVAFGRRAKIDPAHDGAFLFADQNNLEFNSASANEFAVRATGGVRFVTAIDGSGNPTHTAIIDSQGITFPDGSVQSTAVKTYSVGDFAQGGIVFWVDETGQHGLVCAKSDQSTGVRWDAGTNGRTRATGTGIYAGNMNTAIIIPAHIAIGDNGNTYAARICAELEITEGGVAYGDWYLPSVAELTLMYNNKATINATAVANGGSNFASSSYWSSEERVFTSPFGGGIQYHAWVWYFDTWGGSGSTIKRSPSNYVRAVRAF